MATGVPRPDAEAAARRAFGNTTQYQERFFLSQRPIVDTARLRIAVRRLARTPFFTATVITILGLAIGAATLAFSAVYTLVLRPLPFRDPQSLVQLWVSDNSRLGWQSQDVIDAELLRTWRVGQSSFTTFTAYEETSLRPHARIARSFSAARVDGNFFSTLGVGVTLGRPIQETDDDAAALPAIVLSHHLWESAFGSKSDALGTTWRLNATTYVIIGVAPPGIDIPGGEAWISSPGNAAPSAGTAYQAIGRLKRGVSVAVAQAQLSALVPHAETEKADSPRRGALVAPLSRAGGINRTLALMIAAIALLLAVAVANLGTLFLVRSLSRLKLVAISTALGATRRRVRGDTIIEGLLLGLAAAGIGLAVAGLARVALQDFIANRVIHRAALLPLSAGVLGFAIVLGAALGGLLAALPEGITQRIDLADFLRGGGAGSGINRAQARWRRGLVGLQVGCAVIASTAAVALVRSSEYLEHLDVGFDAKHIVTVPLEIWDTDYGTDASAHKLADRIAGELFGTSGLSMAAIWTSIGFEMPRGPDDVTMTAEGSPIQMDSRHCNWALCAYLIQPVSNGFFTTFEVGLRHGRLFESADRSGSTPVVIINEQAANAWWPAADPIGKRIRVGNAASTEPWLTVVGVVANIAPLNEFGRIPRALKKTTAQPVVYEPLAQANLAGPFIRQNPLTVGVRAPRDPDAVGATLHRHLATLLPDLEIPTSVSMQTVLQGDAIAAPVHLNTAIAVTVTLLTMLLAIIGIAGVVAESVRHRTREIGVRMALGATGASIVRLVCRGTLTWLGGGVVAGVVTTLLLHRTIAHVVFQASQTYPNGLYLFGQTNQTLIVAVSAVGVLLVGLAAAAIPARIASTVDPVIALRSGSE